MAERTISLDDDAVDGNGTTPAVSAPTNAMLPLSWKGNIEFINHLTLFNNVLISVLADKGAGKSTFVTKLQEGVDGSVNLFCTEASVPFKPRPMMAEFVKRFNLKVGKKQAAEEIVAQINERKIPVLMVIDGAEVVSDEWLSEILTIIAANKENYFHLCLISDFSMAATLNALEVNFNNLIHTIELGGLNEEELKTYVTARYPDEKILETCQTSQWHDFFEETGGKFARVNTGVLAWLETLKATPLINTAKRFKPMFAYAAAGALTLSAVLALGYHHFHKKPALITAKVTKPLVLSSTLVEVPLFSSHLAAIDVSIFENVKHVSALPVFSEAASRTEITKPKTNIATADAVVVATKSKKPHAPKVIKHAKAKIKPIAYKYTIQLAAGQKIQTLKIIIKQSHLSKAKIKTAAANGAQWYVLVYGQFTTRHEAEEYISHISRLNGLKPWVRELTGLKAVG